MAICVWKLPDEATNDSLIGSPLGYSTVHFPKSRLSGCARGGVFADCGRCGSVKTKKHVDEWTAVITHHCFLFLASFVREVLLKGRLPVNTNKECEKTFE